MRLGQLARKLALRPADIVEFLGKNNIVIADGTNTRLEEDHITLVMKQFVPGWTESRVVEETPEPEEEIAPSYSLPESSNSAISDEEAQETNIELTPSSDQDEVIRAPKIELSGLKVVGRIDLPEPKKKEEPAQEETAQVVDSIKEHRDNRKPFDAKRKQQRRPEKNPIALQRERDEREAQKKREEERIKEKERRTQNYLKNYKPAPPTKAARIVKEDLVEMTPQDLVEPPKTIFGKIMRWLTNAS